jgi:hypothetical protein
LKHNKREKGICTRLVGSDLGGPPEGVWPEGTRKFQK